MTITLTGRRVLSFIVALALALLVINEWWFWHGATVLSGKTNPTLTTNDINLSRAQVFGLLIEKYAADSRKAAPPVVPPPAEPKK